MAALCQVYQISPTIEKADKKDRHVGSAQACQGETFAWG